MKPISLSFAHLVLIFFDCTDIGEIKTKSSQRASIVPGYPTGSLVTVGINHFAMRKVKLSEFKPLA